MHPTRYTVAQKLEIVRMFVDLDCVFIAMYLF